MPFDLNFVRDGDVRETFSWKNIQRSLVEWTQGVEVSERGEKKKGIEENGELLEKLRELGVVRRRGLYSRFGSSSFVIEDPRTGLFYPGGVPSELVVVDEDISPSIVVRILGSLDDPDFQNCGAVSSLHDLIEEKRGVTSVRRMTQSHNTTAEDILPQRLEQMISESLSDDNESMFRSIIQMICGSLPKCGETERTLLVSSHRGKLQTELGNACAMFSSCEAGCLHNVSVVNSEARAQTCVDDDIPLQITVKRERDIEPLVMHLLDQLWVSGAKVSRKKSSVAYVLVGGDEHLCSRELLHAVQRKWPIFILEGSKGYADHLCRLLRRIENMHPNSGVDEIRASTASAAPEVAEILTQGDITVVSAGSSVKEFQQAVLFNLRGDETLRQAWSHYAQWQHNEELYIKQTRSLQVVILLLGILTMSLTIIQSFLQLLYPNVLDDNAVLSGGEHGVRIFMLANNLALIVLPILTSLFQAVLFKSDPASKYVTLRRCSQLMLREIFMYRTQTRGYSVSAVNSQRKRLAGDGLTEIQEAESDDDQPFDAIASEAVSGESVERGDIDERLLDTWSDNEGYFSRQDLLFRRISALSEEVSSAMADAPLWEYKGSLPPAHITETTDDGFSPLSPAGYIKFRLNVACRSYVNSSSYFRSQFNVLTYCVYGFGSIGTMLAAFAVYGTVSNLNLQFWVALTTSAQNALSRFLDYTRVEHLMQEHSKAKESLTVVSSWWSQLEQPTVDTDSQTNRDGLIGRVETCITREVEESGSHMKNLVSRMQKAQVQQENEHELLKHNLETKSSTARLMLIQSLGVGNLSAEKIKAALSDPACPVSSDIVQTLDRIEEIFESRPLDDDELQRYRDLEAGLKHKSFGDLLCEGVKEGNFVPVDVRNMLKDPKLLPRVEEEIDIAKDFSVNRSNLLRLAKVKTEFANQLANFPLRRTLITFKKVLEDLVVSQFEKSLESIGVNLYKLVGTRSEAEYLIGELSSVVASPDWQSQSLDDILVDIKDADILRSIRALGESTVRAMLKRAQRFFTSKSGAPSLLAKIVKFIAVIDIDDLMSDPQSTLDRAAIRADILRERGFARRKSKVELLELLPPAIRQHESVAKQSKTQLVAYFDEIVDGGFEFDVVESVIRSTADEQRPSFLRTPEGQARFFFSIGNVSHDQLFNVSHDVTLRLMAVSPFFTQSFANELRAHYIKSSRGSNGAAEAPSDYVSLVRTAASKSFQLNQFRLVCSTVVDVDLDSLVASQKDRVCLVNLVLDSLVNPAEAWENASDVLLSLTPRIALRLQSLGVQQLLRLFETMASLCRSTFAATVVSHLFEKSHILRFRVDFPQWTKVQCSRFVYSCLATRSRSEISDRVVLDMIDAVDALDGDDEENEEFRDAMYDAIKKPEFNGEPLSFSMFTMLTLLNNLGLVSRDVDGVIGSVDLMRRLDGIQLSPALFFDTQLVDQFPVSDSTATMLRFVFVFGPFVVFDSLSKSSIVMDLHAVFPRPLHQYLLLIALQQSCIAKGSTESCIQEFYRTVGDGAFDQMFSVLGRLTKHNVQEMVENYLKLQTDDILCRVVGKLHAFPADLGRTTCVHARVALFAVASRGVFHGDYVSKQLFGLDANSFLTALPDDKSRRFGDVVDDEEIAATLCKLSNERIKDWFSFASQIMSAPRDALAIQRVEEAMLLQTLGDCVD
ncbi:transmembrane protein, putative [Bodo saltans]|uniref:Transmembrane protein, putative n=1 Tax=Bodo saltans TaxID=75058 RepID=A0A0S4JNR3_BODSA|nr:transmembrane protein, putative [Bodo saltans]|eukprot:CUG91866.1 transmembrane protein, putative [Bodo saltans]